MSRRLAGLPLTVLIVIGCGTTPPPSATGGATEAASPIATSRPTASPAGSPTAAEDAQELPGPGRRLAAGTYQHAGFVPPITFAVEDGWTTGTVSDGFFDVQQDAGTPDVIAVQFARVLGITGADGAMITPSTASDAAAAITTNPALTVLETSDSRLGGLEGSNLVVENRGSRTAPVLDVTLGSLGFDPGRRLWISLFDTDQGVVAVLVGGSTPRWDETLRVAEPVLETVAFWAPASGASPNASAAEPIRIALGGKGPLGIDIDGDSAWVVLTDSGALVEVDLSTQQVARSIPIGTGGLQVIASDDGSTIYVGRYDTGGVGMHVATVDTSSEAVDGIDVGPVGGLALEGNDLWAFLKTGAVDHIDATTGEVTGSVTVHVDQDAHMEAAAGGGAVWVSGDRTPVHRISGTEPAVDADIETGGGIPLDVEDGLVWGARPDELWAIDPVTDQLGVRIPLVGVDEILALDVDGVAKEAWIAIRRPGRVGAVIAVDTEVGTVLSETPVDLPAGVRLTDDRAWVTDYEGDELIGIARS